MRRIEAGSRGWSGVPAGELGIPVADHQPQRRGSLAEVHHHMCGRAGWSRRRSGGPSRRECEPAGWRSARRTARTTGATSQYRGGRSRPRAAQTLAPAEMSASSYPPRGAPAQSCRRTGHGGWCRRRPGAHQFSLDSPMPPARILAGQAEHEITYLTADARASRPVRIGPPPTDQTTVPGQQRGRCDNPMLAQLTR